MASGDTVFSFKPQEHEPVATNGATFDNNNQHPIMDQADSADQETVFTSIMQENYSAATGITIDLFSAAASAITGDVDYDVQLERITDGITNLDTDSFAAVQSINNTNVPTGAGNNGQVFVATVTFTAGAQMDNIVAGDGFRIKIIRVSSRDTAAGDIGLRLVHGKET